MLALVVTPRYSFHEVIFRHENTGANKCFSLNVFNHDGYYLSLSTNKDIYSESMMIMVGYPRGNKNKNNL